MKADSRRRGFFFWRSGRRYSFPRRGESLIVRDLGFQPRLRGARRRGTLRGARSGRDVSNASRPLEAGDARDLQCELVDREILATTDVDRRFARGSSGGMRKRCMRRRDRLTCRNPTKRRAGAPERHRGGADSTASPNLRSNAGSTWRFRDRSCRRGRRDWSAAPYGIEAVLAAIGLRPS